MNTNAAMIPRGTSMYWIFILSVYGASGRKDSPQIGILLV